MTMATDLPPFCAAFFFSCSANASKAEVEGSFKVRKPRTPALFLLAGFRACEDLSLAALLLDD